MWSIAPRRPPACRIADVELASAGARFHDSGPENSAPCGSARACSTSSAVTRSRCSTRPLAAQRATGFTESSSVSHVWLLIVHDLADGDELLLTQEFLGLMLGVGRVSVNQTAGALQKARLIDYRPGVIMLLDRDGLEGPPARTTLVRATNTIACWATERTAAQQPTSTPDVPPPQTAACAASRLELTPRLRNTLEMGAHEASHARPTAASQSGPGG